MNHAERYLDLIARCPKQLDAQYRAAFYLLSIDREIYEIAKRHVDVVGIDFTGILKVCGQLEEFKTQIVRAAHDLFGSAKRTTTVPKLSDVANLGAPYVGAVVAAVMVCGEQAHIEVQTDPQGRPVLAINTERFYKNLQLYQALTDMGAAPFPAGEGEEDGLGR